jgi:threonine synthase
VKFKNADDNSQGEYTYVVAIKGNFDDAQSGVKKIFTDKEFSRVLEKIVTCFLLQTH